MNMTEKKMPARVAELLNMLTYARPDGGPTEEAFVRRYIMTLPGATPDGYGNVWVEVVTPGPVLWSSHTDTVHTKGGMQKIVYGDGVVTTEAGRDCLGADCTTGVWIMRNMILRGVPGTYVFHASEETGGKGSSWIRDSMAERLATFKYAIAFDRAGYDDIITHQITRCASDAFAKSLSEALNMPTLVACDGGTFTDTANYADIIPECTNISVGYLGQHTKAESQDVPFACMLLDALCAADFSTLVCERDPARDDEMADWYGQTEPLSRRDDTPRSLYEYVHANPGEVSDLLECLGYTLADLTRGTSEN